MKENRIKRNPSLPNVHNPPAIKPSVYLLKKNGKIIQTCEGAPGQLMPDAFWIFLANVPGLDKKKPLIEYGYTIKEVRAE